MGNFLKVVAALLLSPTVVLAQLGGGGLPLVCTPSFEFQAGGVLCIAEDGINTAQLDDGANTPTLGYWVIVDGTDTTKLSYWDPTGAIGTTELANGGVTNAKMADDAITQAKLASDGTPTVAYWVIVDPGDATKFEYIARTAAQVTNVPAGDVAAVTVQAAIDELDTEKAKDFLGLDDSPSSYAGQGGKFVAVKNTVDGVEFVDAPSGGGGATIMSGEDNLFGSAVFANYPSGDFTVAYIDACVGGTTDVGRACPGGAGDCDDGTCTTDARVDIALHTDICRQGATCSP